MPKNPELVAGDILIAEYNYIAQTIFQADEDRSRVASFYMVSFGGFIAALVSSQFNATPALENLIRWGFTGLFVALAFMGVLTILHLVRLRDAWFDGVTAMNKIKDYYIANFKGLDAAFAWRSAGVPQKFKPESVGFILAIQIAIVGGASFGSAVFFAMMAIFRVYWIEPAILTGIVFFLFQVWLYRRQLLK